MARPKRPHGAGSLYIKHGSYYGRWMTADSGLANRRLGRVRVPGTREGLTRRQAEKRLRELMDVVEVVRQSYVRGEFKAPKSRLGVRGVPLAERLIRELATLAAVTAFHDDECLVFGNPETGDPLDRSSVRKRFQRACRRADVRVVRFHDLRHTFGTRIAASGEVSLRTLQEWMGHRDARTTLIYADYQPGEHEAEMVSRAFAS